MKMEQHIEKQSKQVVDCDEVKTKNLQVDEETEVDNPPKEKYWLGVICGIFVPFFIAVLIGYSLFDAGTLERKTFFQTYWGTFGIVYTIGIIVGIVWGALILKSRKG